jgi:hypothetical protein
MVNRREVSPLRRLRPPPAAAVAGILFAVLFASSLVLLRSAVPEDPFAQTIWVQQGKTRITVALVLAPVACIAFLWFIGVVREQLGDVEDRLFSTVFLGSGLLFLAMLFIGAVTSTSLLAMFDGSDPNAQLFAFGRSNTQTLISVYAMRMAAVFTLSVSTVGLRTSGLPRWVSYLGYLVAVTLLLAAGEHKWFQLLFPAWVLLVSLVILLVRPPTRISDGS